MSVRQASSTRLVRSPLGLPHPARLSPAVVDTTCAVVTRPLVTQVPFASPSAAVANPVVTQVPVTQVPVTPVKSPKFTIKIEDAIAEETAAKDAAADNVTAEETAAEDPASALSETEENPAPASIAIKKTGKRRVMVRPDFPHGPGKLEPMKVHRNSVDRCRSVVFCLYSQSAWSPYCIFHSCSAILEDKTQCPGEVHHPTPTHRYCDNGYHRENGTFDYIIEAQAHAAEERIREARERQEEMDFELEFYSKKYPILNDPWPITGPPRSSHRGSFASSSSGTSGSSLHSFEEYQNFYGEVGWGACPIQDSRIVDIPRKGDRSRNISTRGVPRTNTQGQLAATGVNTGPAATSIASTSMVRGGLGVSIKNVRSCPPPRNLTVDGPSPMAPGPATFVV